MPKTVLVDPFTRIEGHMKIAATVDGGKVVEAKSSGTLFRGFEVILVDRDPLDAVQITQRFCGVCPTAHAMASAQCLDNAFVVMPTENGRLIRNLIQGANYIQSHTLHFYHLAALDYFRGPDVPPFIPRYEADYRFPKSVKDVFTDHYIQAFHIRLKAHELSAVWSGKIPHVASVVPGGVTVLPSIDKVTTSIWRLKELRDFIDNVYLPDVLTIAEVYRDYLEIGTGCKNLLSYGVYDLDNEPDVTKRKRLFQMGRSSDGKVEAVDPDKITEDVKYAWYDSPSHAHPSRGQTSPAPTKPGAYSWLKSPRYDGKVYEVGPLARVMLAHTRGDNPKLSKLLTDTLGSLRVDTPALYSVLGRHIARALECKYIADEMEQWVLQVKLDEPVCNDHTVPKEAKGAGMWDAARGALGHWIEIKDEKIARYQAVVPTTWNASPKDDKGQPGPIEQAILGTEVEDPENPFAIARIVRSFDPCIACAVHLLQPGKMERTFRF
jgi:hydrogenase large subunit